MRFYAVKVVADNHCFQFDSEPCSQSPTFCQQFKAHICDIAVFVFAIYDKIIFVSAPSDIRKKRLIERNNYTEEYAQKRISAQECEEEKIKKSDFVIENNTDLCELKNKTLEVLRNLTNLL